MEASGLILNTTKEKQNSKQSPNPKPSSPSKTYLPLEWSMSNLGIRSQSAMELDIESIRQRNCWRLQSSLLFLVTEQHSQPVLKEYSSDQYNTSLVLLCLTTSRLLCWRGSWASDWILVGQKMWLNPCFNVSSVFWLWNCVCDYLKFPQRM